MEGLLGVLKTVFFIISTGVGGEREFPVIN
jgi:hypothetical protein